MPSLICSFYRSHGLDADTTAAAAHRRPSLPAHDLRSAAHVPPPDRGRDRCASAPAASRFSPAAAMRPSRSCSICRAENLLFCADQVLARISPNISVQAMDPEGDPLGIYLRSLASLQRDIPRTSGAAGTQPAVRRLACAHRRAARAPRSALPRDRAGLPAGAAHRRRPGAGGVPARDRRSAPDGFRLQRGARSRQLHAARASHCSRCRAAAGVEFTAPFDARLRGHDN